MEQSAGKKPVRGLDVVVGLEEGSEVTHVDADL